MEEARQELLLTSLLLLLLLLLVYVPFGPKERKQIS
jgi:hypothetical protein